MQSEVLNRNNMPLFKTSHLPGNILSDSIHNIRNEMRKSVTLFVQFVDLFVQFVDLFELWESSSVSGFLQAFVKIKACFPHQHAPTRGINWQHYQV